MKLAEVRQADFGTARLPEAEAEDFVQKDFPLVIATMPANERQRAIAAGMAIILIVAAAVIAPFASIQLPRVDGFIPGFQTVVSVADLVTATLLFAQFSIQPQRALLSSRVVTYSAACSRSCRRWLFRGHTPLLVCSVTLALQLGCSCFGTLRFRQRSLPMRSPRM